MSLSREEVVRRIADLMGGRAVRWLPRERAVGDYEGRERTIEVFDADAREQRTLLRRLGAARLEIEASVGGPLVVVFHTPRETQRLYPEMSSRRAYPALAARVQAWMAQDHGAERAVEPHDVPRLSFEREAA